jgi:hypothetical protein
VHSYIFGRIRFTLGGNVDNLTSPRRTWTSMIKRSVLILPYEERGLRMGNLQTILSFNIILI